MEALSSTNDTLGGKSQGGVNDSGPESAEQEVRSADPAGASVLKSSDDAAAAAAPQKSMETEGANEPLVSPMTLGTIFFILCMCFDFTKILIFLMFSVGFLNFCVMGFR